MPKILTDIFSIFEFEKIYDIKPFDSTQNSFEKIYHLIENIIVCENILLDRNGVEFYGLYKICNEFDEVFSYFESSSLYPNNSKYLDWYQLPYAGDIRTRGEHYMKLANKLGCYFSPHPQRYELLNKNIPLLFDSSAKEIINYCDKRLLYSELGNFVKIDIKVPPLIEHVLYFSKKNNLSLSASINEIRNSKNAIKFRLYCNYLDEEIRDLTPRKKFDACQNIFQDIDRLCKIWETNLDSGVKYIQRHINLSKIPLIGKLFEIAGIKEVKFNDPILVNKDSNLLFLNDIYRK